ncbi:histidine kinase [Ruminococcus sp. Marseille-P6503]|uniref:sensor histidine kinase n=1 Tax=Ruminococcus sp. Marseille-P6503 TaxID=2364796 RepID=UPI000F521795|nr:histidine kinase [Ruminococcus sp. Marseille-P6503]
MNKALLYLVFKLTMLAASAGYCIKSAADITAAVISALVLCCLFFTEAFTLRYRHGRKAFLILSAAGAAVCLYTDKTFYFPVLISIVLCIIDIFTDGSSFLAVSATVLLLLGMIFTPDFFSLTITIIGIIGFLSGKRLIEKLSAYKELSLSQRQEIADLRVKLSDMKSYSAALKQSAALEERNRFAARIHDELGHGISGSIIMLEAARISMASNPDKSGEIIDKAIDNLRNGVDSIRVSLREERPERRALGLSEIETIMKHFSANYNIKTEINASDGLERITPQIWLCIRDNLTEALTNTLKHSEADLFTFSLQTYNKVIRAEYRDNGKCGGDFRKGLGLEAIEERTALCGGKSLFRSGQNGFSITNIFILNQELQL